MVKFHQKANESEHPEVYANHSRHAIYKKAD